MCVCVCVCVYKFTDSLVFLMKSDWNYYVLVFIGYVPSKCTCKFKPNEVVYHAWGTALERIYIIKGPIKDYNVDGNVTRCCALICDVYDIFLDFSHAWND